MDHQPGNTVPPVANWPQVRRDRWHLVFLLLVSVPVTLIIPWLFFELTANAQAGCVDLDAGGRLALTATWLGLMLISGWAFMTAAVVAGRLRLVARIAVGLVAVLVICLGVTRMSVPLGQAADYPTTNGECGLGGVPTWWPAVLPHG